MFTNLLEFLQYLRGPERPGQRSGQAGGRWTGVSAREREGDRSVGLLFTAQRAEGIVSTPGILNSLASRH